MSRFAEAILIDVISCDIAGDMKIVFDTSVMVAAFRSPSGASAELLRKARRRELVMCASVAMLLEYEAVLKRPEHLLAAGLGPQDVEDLLDACCIFAQPVVNHFRWRPILDDPDDDMVLETAVNGGADTIVTFNVSDFEPAKKVFGIYIALPGAMLRSLR